jgi:hypothetical protein
MRDKDTIPCINKKNCFFTTQLIQALRPLQPPNKHLEFYVVRTVHFGMKMYTDQRNAKVFILFIYLLLPYMFRAFF